MIEQELKIIKEKIEVEQAGEGFIQDSNVYLMWVKAVNNRLSEINNSCLSCYSSTSKYLKYWYVQKHTPQKAADKVATLLEDFRKDKCICAISGNK